MRKGCSTIPSGGEFADVRGGRPSCEAGVKGDGRAARLGPASRRELSGPTRSARQRALDAALAVLHDEGVAAVTMRAVAERAGVSATALYRLFTDKDGLRRRPADAPKPGPRRAHGGDLPRPATTSRSGARCRRSCSRAPSIRLRRLPGAPRWRERCLTARTWSCRASLTVPFRTVPSGSWPRSSSEARWRASTRVASSRKRQPRL